MTLDALRAYGADVDEGLGRCMGNEALYLRLVESVKQEEGFAALRLAVEERRLKDAFEAAHALKGALTNLALTPLAGPVVEITELLRVETDTDYSALLAQIDSQLESLKAL